MPFNQLHYVSLADWNGEADHPGWVKVQESLAALAGPSAAAAAAPPPPAPAVAPPPAAPAPAVVPPPPPPPAAAPSPRGKGGNRLLVIIIVIAVMIIGAVGVLALLKGRGGAPGGNDSNMAAENGAAPAGEAFDQEAVLEGDDEFANVRAGPATDAPIVARINAGEPFNTYQQDGIWWRVRIRGGLTGYLERAHIHLRQPVGVPQLGPAPGNEAAPAPGNQLAPASGNQLAPAPMPPPQQQRPRPPREDVRPRVDPRINQENAGVMYDYCKGAGAGTPQCRALGLGSRRRPRPTAD